MKVGSVRKRSKRVCPPRDRNVRKRVLLRVEFAAVSEILWPQFLECVLGLEREE